MVTAAWGGVRWGGQGGRSRHVTCKGAAACDGEVMGRSSTAKWGVRAAVKGDDPFTTPH